MVAAFFIAIIGLALVFLEFFLPGGVIATCAAILLVLSEVFFAYNNNSIVLNVAYILLLVILTVITVRVALIVVKKRKNTFFLTGDQEGFVAVSFVKEFIGKDGVALTSMRPSGNILVEEKMVQAVSSGEFIEKGTKVRVIGGEGARLIVTPYNE